jgi:hypothetical protein
MVEKAVAKVLDGDTKQKLTKGKFFSYIIMKTRGLRLLKKPCLI